MTDLIKSGTSYLCTLGDGDGKADASIVCGGQIVKTVPNINASKWSNEAWLNLNYRAMTINAEQPIFKNNCLALKVGGVTWKTWPLNQSVLECSLTFDNAADLPAQIELELKDSGNLVYYFQDALTQAEIDEGCSRPDNVVGSYAVYFSKRWNQYSTGKFGHLYRWEAIGADGKKCWLDPLEIQDGKLIIGLPDLSNMVFPIICMGAGDTFGVSAAGASSTGCPSALVCTALDSPDSNGTVTSIDVHSYNATATGDVKVGMYNDNAGTPSTKVGNETNNLDVGIWGGSGVGSHVWKSFSHSQAVTSGTNYWLAMVSSSIAEVSYDSGSGTQRCQDNTTTYPTASWPSPFNISTTSSALYSYRATYTPSAGGTPNAPRRGGIRLMTMLPLWFLAACARNRNMDRRDWLFGRWVK